MNSKTLKIDKAEVLAGAKEAFFKALLVGYAKGKKDPKVKSVVTTFSNGKKVTTEVGNYTVVDEWHTTSFSDYSAGSTTIFLLHNPIWWMSYGGHYPDLAIPLLKRALSAAYQKHWFFGARGVKFMDDLESRLYYINDCHGDFNKFCGREEIHDMGSGPNSGAILGFHEYSGMSFLG